MIKRIIDKQTNVFIRDDFEFNPEIEIGLEVEPSQGLYTPKWNGESWEEGLTEEEIQAIKDSQEDPPQTEEELLVDYVLELDMRLIMLEFGL